jgi:hypothetical protein
MSAVKCGKCLLSEFDMSEFAETVKRYVSLIPADKKSDGAEYARRLGICRGCDMLIDGMCGECGCFVEIRAAKRLMRCPTEKWN